MIGKVIEGRYEGASVNKLPDRNVLFIQTENGTQIALSKSNAISIDDVTDQFPSYGRKVIMVMWNDFETSIIQLGRNSSNVQEAAISPIRDDRKYASSTKKKRPMVIVVIAQLVGIIVVFGFLTALKYYLPKVSDAKIIESSSTEVITTEVVIEVPSTIIETTISPIEYVDTEFLEAIEDSINKRIELHNPDRSDYSYLRELVNAEMAIVGKYEDKEFSDAKLQLLARKYIEGLHFQKDSLDLSYSEHQIKWHEGLLLRYESLCDLHDEFDVFADDPNFVSTYVMDLDNARDYLKALKAIEADLLSQLDGVTLKYVDQYHGSAMYTNNTDYDFDVDFYFWFYDQSGVRFDESSVGFTNIKSEETSKFTFYCPNKPCTFDFFWNIYPHQYKLQ